MEVQIKATNLKLTESVKDYVEKRLQGLDKLIDPEDTSVLCYVEVEKTTNRHQKGEIYRSEVNLHISGQNFRAEDSKEKLFEAIDETKNQIGKELRRYKKKRQKDVRRGGARIKNILRGFRGGEKVEEIED